MWMRFPCSTPWTTAHHAPRTPGSWVFAARDTCHPWPSVKASGNIRWSLIDPNGRTFLCPIAEKDMQHSIILVKIKATNDNVSNDDK